MAKLEREVFELRAQLQLNHGANHPLINNALNAMNSHHQEPLHLEPMQPQNPAPMMREEAAIISSVSSRLSDASSSKESSTDYVQPQRENTEQIVCEPKEIINYFRQFENQVPSGDDSESSASDIDELHEFVHYVREGDKGKIKVSDSAPHTVDTVTCDRTNRLHTDFSA